MKLLRVCFFVGVLLFVYTKLSSASVSSCSVYSDIHQVQTSSSSSVGFIIENTSSSVINWVRITRPSSDFTVTGGSSPSGWAVSSDSSSVTYTNKTLGIGSSQYFQVDMTVGPTEASAVSWTAQTADDGSGDSSTTCTGNSLVSITSGTPDDNPPIVVSDPDFTVDSITSTGAAISWSTDEAARYVVRYGTSTGYGLTSSSDAYATSQETTLASLSANTGYHYQVEVFDAAGNSNVYGDYTFTTAVAQATPTPVTITQTVTQTVLVSPSPAPIPSPVMIEVEFVDRQAPTVEMTTDFGQFYLRAPVISGIVTDNQKGSIVNIEYSADGGRNWIKVDSFTNPGKEKSEFQFLPETVVDGNYPVLVRAADAGGNVGHSPEKILVIDRLSPRVGGGFFTVGPLLLPVDESGLVTTLAGFDNQITVSAVGGATTIDIATSTQHFSLVKNLDTGLWRGMVSFQEAGEFPLVARAVDGAGNKTERTLGTVRVLPRGKVISLGQPMPRAVIAVHLFDPLTQEFVLWDGQAFGQPNPQPVSAKGEYSLELPAGRYYLEVKAPGLKSLRTTIFEVGQTTPINLTFNLQAKDGSRFWEKLVDWFDFSSSILPIGNQYLVKNPTSHNDIVSELPVLPVYGEGKSLSLSSIRGQLTLLTFVTSWSPQTSEQLKQLELVDDQAVAKVVVFVQENASQAAVYQKRGGYAVSVLADPDGDSVDSLSLYTFPTHYLVDQTGKIVKRKLGLLTAPQIVDILIE